MAFTGSSDLLIRLNADPKGFQEGLKRATKSSQFFEKQLAAQERRQEQLHASMESVGTGMMTFGAVVAVGLGLAAKAAIDWESAWTGVLKTVDGTPEQLGALEEELRGLATTLPVTHTEVAKVAEAAGQLGIARKDIAGFTETMLALGVTTNLTSEDAATSLAKLMNIMETAPDDVDRLGATLVELGNKGASTEADILEMGMRIAGAGYQIGLSEAEVLAFAGALSSLGIEAEAGGSAISSIFVRIQQAVAGGGDELKAFAAAAGMSASEFSHTFRTDASGAVDALVTGLARIKSSGGDVIATLEGLGITEIRQRDTMLRMVGAGDLLTQQLSIANNEWVESNALVDEAAKRYQTTESQVAIARNRINDFAISVGETLLPIIGDAVAFLGGLASWFQSMPGWLQGVVTVLLTVVTAVALLGGAALVAVPRIAAFNAALAGMTGPVATKTRAALGATASFLGGPWGIALGVATVGLMMWGAEQADAAARAEDLSKTLDDQTGAITQNSMVWAANEIAMRELGPALKEAGISVADFAAAAMNGGEQLHAMDVRLQEMTANSEITTDSGKLLMENLREMGDIAVDASERWDIFNQMKEAGAVQDAAASESAMELTGAQKALAEALDLTEEQAREGTEAISGLDEAIQALLDRAFGLTQAQDALTQQITKTTEAALENGGALTGNSEAAIENRRNMEDLVGAVAEVAQEQYEATGSADAATAAIQDQIDWLEANAEAMGLSAAEVEYYTNVLEDMKGEYKVDIVTTYYEINGSKRPTNAGTGHSEFSYQTGGLVRGPGGPTDDKITARISNGEFVVRAAATRRHLPLLEAINSGSAMPAMAATGGGGLHVSHLEVKSVGTDFRTQQVRDDLMFHLALSSTV